MIDENDIFKFANYFLSTHSTIRKTATHFNVSKSSMHIYLHKKLKKLNYSLFFEVQKILNKNSQEKHIRGGNSTKQKYKNKKFSNFLKSVDIK